MLVRNFSVQQDNFPLRRAISRLGPAFAKQQSDMRYLVCPIEYQ
jgi:hypothetical protein